MHTTRHNTHSQQLSENLCASCSPEAVNEHIRAFLSMELNGFQKVAGAPGAPGTPKVQKASL